MSDFSDLLYCSKPSLADIRLEAVKVNYDISIIEAIKLSAENAGLNAVIRSNDTNLNSSKEVDIDVSSITGHTKDGLEIYLSQDCFIITYYFDLSNSSIKNKKDRILEVLNECNGDTIAKFYLNEPTNNISFIEVTYSTDRIDNIDKHYKYSKLLNEQFSANFDGDDDLVDAIEILLNRLDVYIDDGLDMNLSGKWNTTEGFEYYLILGNINLFISALSSKYDRLLKLL